MTMSNRDISMGSMKWTKEIDLEVMQINSIEDQKHSQSKFTKKLKKTYQNNGDLMIFHKSN